MSRSAERVPGPTTAPPPRRARPARAFLPILIGTLLLGCGSSTNEPPDSTPAALAIANGQAQTATVAMSTDVRPTVRVIDESGAGVAGIAVTFTVTAGDGWVTDSTVVTDVQGLAAATWYLGPLPGAPQALTAHIPGFNATFTAEAAPLEVGTTYTGADDFVEFRPGDLPVIFSAPHGGTLEPAAIPDRSGESATTVRDANTDDLALETITAFEARTGGAPHVVVMHLHRRKLDPNREIAEAAEGNDRAERAWREYHGFIEAARHYVSEEHGRGLYVDLHGHGHEIPRLELGYLLTRSELAGDDASLNAPAIVQSSSIRNLADIGPATHAELLRGPQSLGSLLETYGYPAVPSTSQAEPGDNPYFTGGYSTARHGSRDGGTIDGIQIEANRVGVRDTESNREAFAAALAAALEIYFDTHYGSPLAAAAVR